MVKKILIIDDNEDNLNLFVTFLQSRGYKTLYAKNGLEGIKLAISKKPHLILMDIEMPVMDGFDAIKILRSESSTKDIPSVALTSYNLREGRDGFLKHGFDDYIRKPIGLEELLNAVNEYLNHKS